MNANLNTLDRRTFLKTLTFAPIILAGKIPQEAFIQTVNSRIPKNKLGTSLIHEHILVDFIGADKISPDRWNHDDVIKKVLPYLTEIKKKGIKSIFECTPAYLGRDVLLLQKLSKLTGLQIITNTGFYGASDNKYLPPFAFTETAQQLSARWTGEFKDGIDKTDIKPGFIKIGVAPGSLSELHRKLVYAAALTHMATGLTICSHTGEPAPAAEQLDILESGGVAPSAFVWVHAKGSNEEIKTLAKRNCWVSLDGVNNDNLDYHVGLISYLKSNGCLNRVLISHDAGWYKPGEPDGGEFRGYTTISDRLIPKLKTAGLSSIDIKQLMITNPAEAFAIQIRKV